MENPSRRCPQIGRLSLWEIYGSDLLLREDDDPEQISTLCLLVQNETGYHNLTDLISRAYLEGQWQGKGKGAWDGQYGDGKGQPKGQPQLVWSTNIQCNCSISNLKTLF